MKGLNCLLSKNGKQIQLIGAAMRDMADTMLLANKNSEITVQGLYRQLKSHGIDIDMESAAYIYADTFASDIAQGYSNFHTEDELQDFSKKYPPVSAGVKKALVDAGYGKILRSGKVILDWTKLMQKSEDEIKDEITNAGLTNEDEVLGALQNEWKQVISTALIKAKNSLAQRDKDVTQTQRNAIDRIADLQAKGLFTDFKDDYKNAIHKAIGTSRETLGDLDALDNLAKTARLLQDAGYGTNNDLGTQLQAAINNVIAIARYRAADKNYFYKIVHFVSDLLDMVNFSTLNNLGNRGQNFLSGKAELTISRLNYDASTKEILNLATQIKRDIIRNGAADMGDVNNILHGNRRAADKVRQLMTGWINDKDKAFSYERAGNWAFAQLFGTAALNGVDNSMKVKNTWVRFISAMEDIIVAQHGATKQVAKEALNKELFGQSWEDARNTAQKTMQTIKDKGGTLEINPQSVERFTADVVKAQLVTNGLITEEQLNAAWNGAYRSAGRAMGHVPNNKFTIALNKIKTNSVESIENYISEGKYSSAAWEMILDMFVNKILFRFAGGGTNWLILKAEKGGLGLFSGLFHKVSDDKDYRTMDEKSISSMSGKELEDAIYAVQKSNDKFARGGAGALVNTLLLTTAVLVLKGDEDDEDDLKSKLVDWLDGNKWANKFVNNWIPFYVTAWIAYERQKKSSGGMAGIGNFYKSSPARSYMYNFVNQQERSNSVALMKAATDLFSDNEEKRNSAQGSIGIITGQYFNIDPIPYRTIKDVLTMSLGISGNLKQDAWESPKSFMQGYLKWGITDFPKIKNKSEESETSDY